MSGRLRIGAPTPAFSRAATRFGLRRWARSSGSRSRRRAPRCCCWRWRESRGTDRRRRGWRSPFAPRAGRRCRCAASGRPRRRAASAAASRAAARRRATRSASLSPLHLRAGIVAAVAGVDHDARDAESELARQREAARGRSQRAWPAAAGRPRRIGGGDGDAGARSGRRRWRRSTAGALGADGATPSDALPCGAGCRPARGHRTRAALARRYRGGTGAHRRWRGRAGRALEVDDDAVRVVERVDAVAPAPSRSSTTRVAPGCRRRGLLHDVVRERQTSRRAAPAPRCSKIDEHARRIVKTLATERHFPIELERDADTSGAGAPLTIAVGSVVARGAGAARAVTLEACGRARPADGSRGRWDWLAAAPAAVAAPRGARGQPFTTACRRVLERRASARSELTGYRSQQCRSSRSAVARSASPELPERIGRQLAPCHSALSL